MPYLIAGLATMVFIPLASALLFLQGFGAWVRGVAEKEVDDDES